MAGTVCFAVLASAQAALAEILGQENVSPGLPEATAEAALPKLTAFFQQLIRQTAAEQATGRPGAPVVPASALAVPSANFDAQPVLRAPDPPALRAPDLPEPGERALEANPAGEVQVQVVAVTTGNTTATWTGRLRPSGSDRDFGEEQSASWQDHLRASATAFGKMNADLPGPDELAVEAASIVELHHQSPPFDQSADAAAEARDYGEQYRFVVEAIAGFLRRAGQAQAHLSPGRRLRLVTVLSDALSRQLKTRPRRSAAPPGGADHRRGHYAPPNTPGAGTSRIAPSSSRVRSSSEDDGHGARRVRPRQPGLSPRERVDGGQRLLALVNRSLTAFAPSPDTASVTSSLISALNGHLSRLDRGSVPDEARAAQIANMIAVDGLDAPQAFVDSRRAMTASTAARPAEDPFFYGVYHPEEARDPSIVPFRQRAVRIRAFAANESRPAGISLAGSSGTGKLERFLTDVWTVQRAHHPFDSFLLPAPADDEAMRTDEAGTLTVAPPWHVDNRNGGTFFVGLRGSVTSENGVSRFVVEAERGGTLSIDADTLARLLLSDPVFEDAMDEHGHSLTLLGWENGIPATLADDLAQTMKDRLDRDVSVYAATGTVVVGQRADRVRDNGWVGVAGGGHWQVSGYREPEHNSAIASELASALAHKWRYAQPRQAAGHIDDSNRHLTLQLTRAVADSISAGLAQEPEVLLLEEAAQKAEKHVNPYLPVLAALKLLTRDQRVAASIREIRDVWTVRADSTDHWVMFPVVREIWTRLGGIPGPVTSTGRAVMRGRDAHATGGANRLTIRPGEISTTGVGIQLDALARQLAEAARPGLGGVSEHADIVVYGGEAGSTQADQIRDRLVSRMRGVFRRLGIHEPDLAERVVLPFRHAVGSGDATDPRIEIDIRPRADLVLEQYPWLPDVNPRRAEGGTFMMNCTLAAIEVDGALEHGVVHPVPAAVGDFAYTSKWARLNGRGFFRVGRGLAEINQAMQGAAEGSRALLVVYYRNPKLPGHAFNVVRHPRLGVVYLDGQTSNGDPLRAMRDYPEEPPQVWFVPTDGNIEPVGVPLTDKQFIAAYGMPPVAGPASHGQRGRRDGDPSRASSVVGPDQSASGRFEAPLGTVRPRDTSSSDEERRRDSRNTRPRLLAPPATGQGHPAPPALPSDPEREAAELIDRLVRDTRPIPPREQILPGLGPDLFGSREAPPAPSFMRRVYLDELDADQIVPFLRGISMTNQAPPAVGDLTSGKLPHQPDTVMTADLRNASGRLLPRGRSRAPKLAMAIWLGGPPDVRRPEWRGLEGIRRSLGHGATMVLLTDVPRAHVEDARRAASARGPRFAGQPRDRFEAERARRLERMISWLKWADDNAVLLVNVDEISYKDQPLTLDDASRAERARRTGYGFARASDIVRFSFTEVLGGLYVDWDNAVSAALLNAPEGELLNSLQRLFGQQGYAVQVMANGDISNAAFMAGIGHPFTKAVLRQISAKYGKTQRQLYAEVGFPHEPVGESPDKDEKLVGQWVIPPEQGKRDLRNFRRSILLRTGPAATVNVVVGASPPRLTQFDIGFANSWEGGISLQAERTYLPEEVYEVIRDVVATLVRDLYNREGDLHLTAVAPVIAGLPDPDLGWRTAIGYIVSQPGLRGLVTTVTDRDTWSPDERHTQTVVIPLPADVRASLGLSDAPTPEGEWLRGELARPTSISTPGSTRPGQALASGPRHQGAGQQVTGQQGTGEELDPRARTVASEFLRQRGYLDVVPGTSDDSGDNAAFIDEVARALQQGGDHDARRAAEEGARRRRRPEHVVRVQMARSDPGHGALNQQILREKLASLTPGSEKYKAVQAALDSWGTVQGPDTGGVPTPGSVSGRRDQDGDRSWPEEKIGQPAGKQPPEGRKGSPVSAIAEVHQFGATGMGRRLNLTDLATEGQLAAIARSGGLAGHDAVEALAARIAAAFTVPADGPDGPAADVALTLTIPAGRTPTSITSGSQIVQAVATKLRHPVFVHLEETGMGFKVCW